MNYILNGMQEFTGNPGHDTGEIDGQEAQLTDGAVGPADSDDNTEKGETAVGTETDEQKEPPRRGRKRKKESNAAPPVPDGGDAPDGTAAWGDEHIDPESPDIADADGDVSEAADRPVLEDSPNREDGEPGDDPPAEEDGGEENPFDSGGGGGLADMFSDGHDGAVEEEGEPEEDGDADAEAVAAPRRRRSRALLDSSGRVIQRERDDGQNDIAKLSAAWNNRRVLTTTLDSYEADGSGKYRVFFYVGKVKVIIPWDQMGLVFEGDTPDPVDIRLQIDSMIGAVIDYMVRGIDVDNLVAAASRSDAMIVRRRTILNRKDGSGDYLVDVGTQCMARALHISRRFVRMEVFGYVTEVRIGDVSNLWVNDVREVVEIGGEYPVEVLALERDEDGQVTRMQVSLQAAEEQSGAKMVEGNTYTGTICSISRTAYYVKVNGVPADVRCPLRSNHVAGMMVGDVVKFYVRAIYPQSISGAITKILKRPEPGTF